MNLHWRAIMSALWRRGQAWLHRCFALGLQSRLTQPTDRHAIDIPYLDDPRFLLAIQREQPDLVLLVEDSPLGSQLVRELLKDAPKAPPLRVITLSTSSDSLERRTGDGRQKSVSDRATQTHQSPDTA